MIRDLLRAAMAVAVMAAAASILIETRYQLACVDAAHRAVVAASGPAPGWQPVAPQPAQQGRLQRFGRSVIDLADAALGVVR